MLLLVKELRNDFPRLVPLSEIEHSLPYFGGAEETIQKSMDFASYCPDYAVLFSNHSLMASSSSGCRLVLEMV